MNSARPVRQGNFGTGILAKERVQAAIVSTMKHAALACQLVLTVCVNPRPALTPRPIVLTLQATNLIHVNTVLVFAQAVTLLIMVAAGMKPAAAGVTKIAQKGHQVMVY